MWKLTIEDDEGKQTSLPLAHDEYGVGRADDNAIRLTDRNISRRHASIRKAAPGWVLKDLESYNGTFVNGTRVVGEQAIAHGDVVQLGDYRLELVDEAMLPQPAPAPVGAPQVAPAAPAASPLQQRPNRLVMVVGPTPGAEFPLDREYLSIGRAEDASVSINHTSVSRLHAELFTLGNGRYEVVDKQSANGIRINGVELNRGILEAGDALELGDVRLRFVGAGKVFRADMSMTLPAVMGQYASAAPAGAAASARGSGGTGRVVAVGIAIGVLAIVGVLVAMRPGTKPVEPGTPAVQIEPATAADNAKLAEARALLAKGDVDGAHQKAGEIPENSAAREDAGFTEIEGAWADKLFAEAEAQKDLAERRKVLSRIAATPSVDSGRRKKALEAMQAVDAKMAELGTAPPTGVAGGPRPQGGDPYETPTAPATAGTPTAAATPVKPEATAPQGALPPQGPPDEAAMRRALEGKVWGGKASIDEIKLLRAICSHQGDRACRDRATAMLKQKEAGN